VTSSSVVGIPLAGDEQIRRWPDWLKVPQQRNVVFVNPHDIVIIRITRARATRERLAVRRKGPTHIFATCVDGIAKVQWFLPLAILILVGDPHIMSAPRAHIWACAGDNEALSIR
jgi:hypothetical protein